MSWNKYSFPEPIGFIFEQTVFLHDYIVLLGLNIIFLLMFGLVSSGYNMIPLSVWPSEIDKLELSWTIIPLFLLILISIPSIRILSFLEEPYDQFISLKITGSQWFWSYQYLNSINSDFDSIWYVEEDEMNSKPPKLFDMMEVDNRIMLPYSTPVSLLVTSMDVIHAWTLPMLGLKMDAMPGRLNRMFLFSEKPGICWGQCSEICGVNHSFMPITVEFVNIKSILKMFYK